MASFKNVAAAAGLIGLVTCAYGQASGTATPADESMIGAPVQLTTRDKFVKAGEAYFSPDGKFIIFQAVSIPEKGKEPSPFYAMFLGELKRDASGRVTGLGETRQVSPPGSANTCGWFHPTDRARILYGSTMDAPSENQPSGFQVGTRSYRWQFPTEMEVATQSPLWLVQAYGLKPGTDCGTDHVAHPAFKRDGYDAECSYSKDGRFILYTHVELKVKEEGKPGVPDADIWIYDTKTGEQRPLVVAPGYDGGPFFSPDGTRICYRSDRKSNDLLQVYVATLKRDNAGVPIGIINERAITDNTEVNWAPYWHPSGKFLIYGNSGTDHKNYDLWVSEVGTDEPTAKLQKKRITVKEGADILPAFTADGKWLMWTCQRGPKVEGEEKPSSQLWIAEWKGGETPYANAGK